MTTYKRFITYLIAFICCLVRLDGAMAGMPVQTDHQQYIFSSDNGDLLAIHSTYASYKDAQSVPSVDTIAPVLSFAVLDNPALNDAFINLRYLLEEKQENHQNITLIFKSEPLNSGAYFRKIYTLSKKEYFMDVSFAIETPDEFSHLYVTRFQITLHQTGMFSTSPHSDTPEARRAVFIADKDCFSPTNFAEEFNNVLTKETWAGFRDRFFALLIKPLNDSIKLETSEPASTDSALLQFSLQPFDDFFFFRIYAGPIDWYSFGNEKETLSPLLYNHLWFWVRYISFGLFFLLSWLIQITGNHGLSIILLSLTVKILMLPLVHVSDKWQADVNTKKTLLHPHLKEIKSQYKGEEQHRRTLALHKELGIHPMYPLKNFLGLFVQIPIFFAAYHTLGENVSLSGIPFLWIRDLAEPDQFARLPFHLFYFGEYLNLLPFLMTAITVVTAFLFQDRSLSEDLLKKQQLNLYIMALFFLVLFYTFPAGMVLYWTMNNVLSLVKTLIQKSFSGKSRGETG
ncbi:MAG: membrane protein insertase YidC [Proteobacteria bacterium]|nr:membrane protein insertase YidC [Pseudomonadota bacterium]